VDNSLFHSVINYLACG